MPWACPPPPVDALQSSWSAMPMGILSQCFMLGDSGVWFRLGRPPSSLCAGNPPPPPPGTCVRLGCLGSAPTGGRGLASVRPMGNLAGGFAPPSGHAGGVGNRRGRGICTPPPPPPRTTKLGCLGVAPTGLGRWSGTPAGLFLPRARPA